ncbi:MAG: hypothetical protein HYT98_04990 [Candidatus Sungbacteria bacterium]|nr:hypothetical protein [Candidatus Sungbacteria bacterium]
MKSFWRDEKMEETICMWHPRRGFSAASENVLHGGTSGSLIDCNGVWLAIADRYRRGGRRFGDLPIDWWYVSRNFHVELKHPVPTDQGPLAVYTRLIEVSGRKTFTESKILLGEKELVTGTTFSIAVPLTRRGLEDLIYPTNEWLVIKVLHFFGLAYP